MEPITMGMMALSSLAQGGLGALSARSQRKAQKAALAQQERMFQQQMEAQRPWREAGTMALGDLRALLSDPSRIERSPAYQFRIDEGQKALERNIAARGGTLGGGALRELTRYGQGMASDEYQNQFNRLASLAGLGQAATSQSGAYMGQFGAQMGEGLANLGNIKASSYLGMGQALAGGVGDYMNYKLLKDIYGGGGGGGMVEGWDESALPGAE